MGATTVDVCMAKSPRETTIVRAHRHRIFQRSLGTEYAGHVSDKSASRDGNGPWGLAVLIGAGRAPIRKLGAFFFHAQKNCQVGGLKQLLQG